MLLQYMTTDPWTTNYEATSVERTKLSKKIKQEERTKLSKKQKETGTSTFGEA